MTNHFPLSAPRFRVNTLGFHLMEHFRHSFTTFVLADQLESEQDPEAVAFWLQIFYGIFRYV